MAMCGKYMGIRFVTATIIAVLIDSIVFILIAYHQSVKFIELLIMIFNVWIIKSSIEILCLPFSIRLTKKLKQKEEVDVYDYQTRFNIFSIDMSYKNSDNHYLKIR